MILNNMAEEGKSSKVGKQTQEVSDAYYIKKASQMRAVQGGKVVAMKSRNKMVGLLLATGAFGIYGYTMFSVRQGKLLEEFDKVPE